jgi:hypothetical protein
MSRFYLHIRCKDGGMSYDDLGLDYPDVETAWRAVAQAAQDLKHVFATRGHDPRDYAIEVENDTGEVVFRLPFSEHLRSSLSQSHATYKIVGSHLGWLIYCDDEFVGGFAQRSSAESLVWLRPDAPSTRRLKSWLKTNSCARSTFAAASRKRLPEPCCLSQTSSKRIPYWRLCEIAVDVTARGAAGSRTSLHTARWGPLRPVRSLARTSVHRPCRPYHPGA